MKASIILVIIHIGICHCICFNCWNYTNQDTWAKEFPNCGKKMQSPINIETSKTCADPTLTNSAFKFENFELEKNFGFSSSNPLYSYVGQDYREDLITVNIDGRTYTVDGFRFHFGPGDAGSEHKINGKSYAAEMFLMGKESYVIAVLFELSNQDNIKLKPFFDGVAEMSKAENKYAPTRLALNSIIGNIKSSGFFAYTGSSTYPDCKANVKWLVSTLLPEISSNQLDLLRKGFGIQDNRRKIQPLDDRKISYIVPF